MPVVLYYMPASPPCRSVMLAAKALGVDLTLKHLDVMAGEHLDPEFVKISPQHVIPLLDDNGHYVWESRVILSYLANKYSKDDSIYPKCPIARSFVDQRLFFDIDVLFKRFRLTYFDHLFKDVPYVEGNKEKLDESLVWFNDYLGQTRWGAGDHMTIADFTLVVSVSTIEAAKHDITKYGNIVRWYNECKTKMPGYEDINGKGARLLRAIWDELPSEKKKRLTATERN